MCDAFLVKIISCVVSGLAKLKQEDCTKRLLALFN